MSDPNYILDERIQKMVDMKISGLDIMHGELKSLLLEATNELEEAQRIEEDNDYSDAMESIERSYAEGFLDGLSYAYRFTYDVSFARGELEKENA